jgi:hypothetical protein
MHVHTGTLTWPSRFCFVLSYSTLRASSITSWIN